MHTVAQPYHQTPQWYHAGVGPGRVTRAVPQRHVGTLPSRLLSHLGVPPSSPPSFDPPTRTRRAFAQVLPMRPAAHWVASIDGWGEGSGQMRQRLVECDIPGLPAGVGAKDEEMEACTGGS